MKSKGGKSVYNEKIISTVKIDDARCIYSPVDFPNGTYCVSISQYLVSSNNFN